MSEARHTQGPWEVGSGDDYYIRADAYPNNFPHHFKSDDLGDYLALVGNRTHDFGEANASLIAAAPDLLATLKALVGRLDHHFGGPQVWDWKEQAEARTVIAKAEGRSMPHPNQTEPKS